MRQRAGSSARGATTTKGEDTYFANGFRNPLERARTARYPVASLFFAALRRGGGCCGSAATRVVREERRSSIARSGSEVVRCC